MWALEKKSPFIDSKKGWLLDTYSPNKVPHGPNDASNTSQRGRSWKKHGITAVARAISDISLPLRLASGYWGSWKQFLNLRLVGCFVAAMGIQAGDGVSQALVRFNS